MLVRTFTLESLSQQTPEQRPTVVAEGEKIKVVDAEHVRHVDAEPLRTDWLQEAQKDSETKLQQSGGLIRLEKGGIMNAVPFFFHYCQSSSIMFW